MKTVLSQHFNFSYVIPTTEIGNIEQVLKDNKVHLFSKFNLERGRFMRDKVRVEVSIVYMTPLKKEYTKYEMIVAFAQKMGANDITITLKEKMEFKDITHKL